MFIFADYQNHILPIPVYLPHDNYGKKLQFDGLCLFIVCIGDESYKNLFHKDQQYNPHTV